MSGYNSTAFRHKCSEKGCLIEKQPDWSFLAAAFPRGIMPTDIDAMVEIGGHFLFLEGKGYRMGFASEGQRKALRTLSRTGGITVVCIRPASVDADPNDYEILVFRGGSATTDGWSPISKPDLIRRIADWSARSDETPAPNLLAQVRDLQEQIVTLQYENRSLKYAVINELKKGREESA